jgi:hypothetical protein
MYVCGQDFGLEFTFLLNCSVFRRPRKKLANLLIGCFASAIKHLVPGTRREILGNNANVPVWTQATHTGAARLRHLKTFWAFSFADSPEKGGHKSIRRTTASAHSKD